MFSFRLFLSLSIIRLHNSIAEAQLQDNFFEVPIKNIELNTIPDFDLFIEKDGRLSIFLRANNSFNEQVYNSLVESKAEKYYVRNEDLDLYDKYTKRVRARWETKLRSEGYEGIFVSPEEIEQYHDIMDNYFAVDGSLFLEGLEVDFQIFFHQSNRVILLPEFEAAKEGPWKLSAKPSQTRRELMIAKKDLHKYKSFVEGAMKAVLGSSQMQVEKKARVLREMTKLVVQDVLDDPRSGENIKKVNTAVKSMVDFIMENDTSFYSLMRISAHDFYTYVHSLNVCTLCVGLGTYIGLPKKPDLEDLALGAMLHDIGKSQVDARLINKPGKLTEEEFQKMKDHVSLGVQLLRESHKLSEIVLFPVAQHHEKINGAGYPAGIKESQLHLFGRIASIIDIYDALTTVRSYKTAFSPFEALNFLSKTEENYDRDLLRQFIIMLGKQIRP